MRIVVVVLLALVLSAFSGSCRSDPSGTSPSASTGSTVGSVLSELLPTTVNGISLTITSLNPAKRPSPKVFLKVVARLDKKPPDARLVLAFGSDVSVYALRIDGISGSDIAHAFLAERPGAVPDSGAPPEVGVGGKQVIRIGRLPGTFVYASGDVFFYVEAPDESTAADLLGQLP